MVHLSVFLFTFFACQLLNRSQIEKREYFSRMLLLFEFHPHPSVCRGLCFSLWHIVALAKSFAFAPPLSLSDKAPRVRRFRSLLFQVAISLHKVPFIFYNAFTENGGAMPAAFIFVNIST
jgi:hypothetical protein